MQIRAFLDVLRRRKGLMAGCVLVVVCLAALATFLLTPVYQSTSRLYVSAAQAETGEAYAGGLLSEQRVAAYVEIVESDLLATQVDEELDLAETPEEIDAKVSANAVGETPGPRDPRQGPQRRPRPAAEPDVRREAGEHRRPDREPARRRRARRSRSRSSTRPPRRASPVFPKPVLNLTLALILGLVLARGRGAAARGARQHDQDGRRPRARRPRRCSAPWWPSPPRTTRG